MPERAEISARCKDGDPHTVCAARLCQWDWMAQLPHGFRAAPGPCLMGWFPLIPEGTWADGKPNTEPADRGKDFSSRAASWAAANQEMAN